VRFDGVRFGPWASLDGGQLPSSDISSLLGTRDGSLWIGKEGGLSRWDSEHLTNYLITPVISHLWLFTALTSELPFRTVKARQEASAGRAHFPIRAY
jgi:ligand-binding sensor domain-containing protein